MKYKFKFYINALLLNFDITFIQLWKIICKIRIKPSDCIDRYLGCVGEHMKELEPFGDGPHKLSIQLKRSFVATRTFSQALGVASDVITNMVKVRYLNVYVI